MDLQFKSVPFEIKAADGDGSVGRGLGSCFYNIDSYGEIVDDGAFDNDLADFLENGFIGGINHLWDQPVGVPTSARVIDKGLEVSWKLSPTAHGKDVMILLKDRVVKKLSIGFQTLGRQMLETFEDVSSYWQSKNYKPSAEDIARAQSGATLLTRIRLFEVSPVVVPANSLATITTVKAMQAQALLLGEGTPAPLITCSDPLLEDDAPASVREYEKYLRDAGLSKVQAKQAVKMAKTLLRDVASGDAGTPETDLPADGLTPDAGTTPEGDTPPVPDTPDVPDADAPAVGPPDAPPPAPGSTSGTWTATSPLDVPAQDTPPPAPTTTPEELAQLRPKSGPKPLPDDLLPETAAMRQRLASQLHAQFIDIQDRASAWRD